MFVVPSFAEDVGRPQARSTAPSAEVDKEIDYDDDTENIEDHSSAPSPTAQDKGEGMNTPLELKSKSLKDFPEDDANDAVSEDEHKLKSLERGKSEIEQLAHRIETRRANRIRVTFPARVEFLRLCRGLAKIKAYSPKNHKIQRTDVEFLKATIEARIASRDDHISIGRRVNAAMGFRDNDVVLVRVFSRALERLDEVDGNWLYFQDFNYYDTKLEATYPWMRYNALKVFLVIFSFYFFTPVLFCDIMQDEQVCPDDPTDQNRAWYGWLNAVYFASATLSTVGYGDVSVSKDEDWQLFIGAVYMIIAILVGITAFSAAADQAYQWTLSPLSGMTDSLLESMGTETSEKQLLYQHMRKIRIIKVAEIVGQLVLLNFIGIVVARPFVHTRDEDEAHWSWMMTIYWAIQTTTTIGYGDLDMPVDMQFFQCFYLALSTVFVGSAFGRLASLNDELRNIKRHYAWQRREVNKRIIEDMQAYDHDDKVDQYEFVLGSLLTLDKISSADIAPIMDKFRLLAGSKGYIQFTGDTERNPLDSPNQGSPIALSGSFDDNLGAEDQKAADFVNSETIRNTDLFKSAEMKP